MSGRTRRLGRPGPHYLLNPDLACETKGATSMLQDEPEPCVVYYNSSNPAESCLEPGANYFFLAMGGTLSLLLLGGGLYCLARGLRGFMTAR
jgi:hypothetical protein